MAGRGGDRRAAAAANGKKVGRPQVRPDEQPRLDKGFAARVMAQIGKPGWTKITPETAKNDEEYALTFLARGDDSSQRFFDRLLDRRYGKPPQPVFNADTRESAPTVDFGDLPMPADNQPGTTGKPN